MVRDPASGVDITTSAILEFPTGIAAFTCSTRSETDQRVDIYGTDGRISIGIPFNIPPDRPTKVFVTAGGEPPVAPATEELRFDTADPYAVQAERFAAAILDGTPPPIPPEDGGGEPAGHRADLRRRGSVPGGAVEVAQGEGHRVLAAGRADLAALEVVGRDVDAHEQAREPGLVGGVEVRRPLERGVAGGALLVDEVALLARCTRSGRPGSTRCR